MKHITHDIMYSLMAYCLQYNLTSRMFSHMITDLRLLDRSSTAIAHVLQRKHANYK